ncbi:hypothetical protein PEPNEM18_00190 [Aedoeadaptatus nemausensis]|uniref:Uncharacterized protein n=1 Tax=Aedoeadaptatus nemausensis TaxID=2582829 RepID=A0A6V6XZG5_9FIRM|nr:hypothetical protein [Peptoniphilus nemausensis]CAC9923798.1 hypothetical protein PEPNEM18_00190 [Peptoniphilus nemausensis]
METVKSRFLTLLLAFVMIFTSLPMNALAAKPGDGKTEITNIKEQNGKQIVELTKLRGEKKLFSFRNGAGFFSTGAETTDKNIEQKVTINLETEGLNFGDNAFDSSALDEALPFDVTINLEDPVSKSIAQSETVTFNNKGETTKTVTFYVPKRLGQAKVSAVLTALDANLDLRVYKSADSTTDTIGQDLSFDFMISQIVHPVIKAKVTDPYGKELDESISKALGLKLKLGKEEYTFDLPESKKDLNIRTLDTFKDDPFPLNLAGDSQSLELTTQLDENNKMKVGDKTYKLNKITYNALGQEVVINDKTEKVGGYIEFATQPKIVVPTPDESGDLPNTPDGYKRLSFHAESSSNAQDGRFEHGDKLKVIDVLEGTEYTDKDLQKQIKGIGQPTPLINGSVDDSKKFLKWNPALPTTGKVDDTDYWPVYLKDGGEITPGEKLPDGVFEVKVIKDDTIAEDALYGKSYGVFQGSKLARDKFPDLVAAKGHQNPKWTTEADEAEGMVEIAKPWTKVITKATNFKATAGELPDIIENPTDPTPEGYVRVTFKAGEGVEDFKDAKTYDVKEGIALTEDKYPTAEAKVGYKDPKWDVAPGTPITKDNATITATATKIEDIIPGGPGVEKPEGYYIVEFLEGKHGVFKPVKEKDQVTVYYVNPEAKVKMSQITAPTVTAKVGYKFDSWSKEYQADAIITGDRQITAVYIYVDGVSTEAKEGWTKVTLKSGDKGEFTKTTNVEGGQTKTEEFDELVYYVDPEREVTIPAPVVKATVGNTFTGFDKPLTGTFKEETTINAKYLSTSDVIEDKTPGDDAEKPEGYVTVKFDAGQNGTFAPNSITKYFVNPEKNVEIGAPGIDPNKNFVFKGFFNGDEEHSSAAKKYTKDITYTAKYDDKSNESIIPGDQAKPGGWVTISFSAGEHGTFELVNGKQPTIAYHVNPEKDVVLKDKAPAIKANDGYKFTKYDPDVETARKYTTEGQVITAQYKATVVEGPDQPTKPDPNDPGKTVPDTDYAKLTFEKGINGEFAENAKTTIWVLKNEEVKFNAPAVEANEGFVFNGWDPALQTKYTDDKTHTAKYEPKSDISDVPVAGFQEIKFLPGTDGKFEGEKQEKSVWVRPDVEVDLTAKAPKVIANKGKVHTGWEPSLIGTFTKLDKATEITAQYKTDADNNGIADEDEKTPEPEVYARNIGKDPKVTTVEVETEKNADVTIEYKDKNGETKTITGKADDQGKLTKEITPKLEKDTPVKVTVKDGEKQPTEKIVKVFDDVDNNRIPDDQAGQTERPAAIASNKGKTPTFTTIEGKTEKGATITVTVKVNGEEKPVTVENLNVNDDGTYTLEAKYDNKPLENGAEILVYAENAPKTKSAPQTTTVFNDFNNDGKPDGGKVDLNDVKDIQVIAPEKMSYTEGDKLNGTGLKAVVRDNKGGIEIFEYDNATGKFKDADGKAVDEITATVADKAIKDLSLTEKDHNGKAIDVKVGGQTGSTNQVLEVKQLQTPTPTIEFAANQNTVGSDGKTPTGTAKQKTTVKFTVKNKPTKVFVKYTVNGEAKEESFEIGANDDATKTVDLQVKLPVGAEVQVLAKDADKALSEAATAKVVRDANNDGTADDKTPVGKTEIDPIKAESEKITVKPADNATELVIKETDKSGNTPADSKEITVTKDEDGNWKIGDDIIKPDKDGKLTIPTKGKLELDEYNVVEVDAKGDPDTTTPSNARETVGEAADTTAPAMPQIDQPVDGDKDIKVKTPTEPDAKTIIVEVEVPAKPGENPTKKTVEVTKGDDGKWKTPDGKEVPEENGKLVIPVDPAVKTGDKVTVEVKDDSGNASKSEPQTVVERQKLPVPTIDPIKTGERTVSGTAKDAATVDIYKKNAEGGYDLVKEDVGVSADGSYTYNHTDGFKDGDVIRVVAKKLGMTPNNAETTVGVDTSALDKAITDGKSELDKRNDGTPADKALEDAIKEGEDLKKKDPAPSQEEVDQAKDKIEKAIEDKKKADEARDKLKEIIKEAEEETKKDGYEEKPGKDRRELEKTIKEGKESLENNTNIPESTEKIEKALEKIRKETLQVSAKDPKVGDQSITITTYPSLCEVEVFINDVSMDKIKTNGFGTYSFTLDEPIKAGTTIELKAHKDGYNDNSYWTKVK